jgi:hypothetical protein
VEDGAADGNVASNESNQIDTNSLNVGPDSAWRDLIQSQVEPVLSDLFPFDETHLAAGWFISRAAAAFEIPGLAENSFVRDYFNRIDLSQRTARRRRVEMKGSNASGKGRGDAFVPYGR